jgi:hypothetical protein
MATTMRITLAVVVCATALIAAACSPSAPALPTDISPDKLAGQISGADGTAFLRDVTTHEWSDEGQRAGEMLSWIPRDAGSSDTATAARAGTTAHALAEFLADHYTEVKDAGSANPALIQSYAAALIPYSGAMVGDPSGTSGFEPLDRLGSPMQRTALVFAVIARDDAANRELTDAAKNRASEYEQQFANYAAADPSLTKPDPRREPLAWAARLLGLVAAGDRLANPDTAMPLSIRPATEVQYEIVSRMVRRSDPRISPEYFNPDGTLKSPDKVGNSAWSLYDSQLANYLASYPRLSAAVSEFDSTYLSIANR